MSKRQRSVAFADAVDIDDKKRRDRRKNDSEAEDGGERS